MQNQDIMDIASQQVNTFYLYVFEYLKVLQLNTKITHIFTSAALLIIVSILLIITDLIVSKLLKSIFIQIIQRTKNSWDDLLIQNRVLDHISHLVLIIIAQQIVPNLFYGFDTFKSFLGKLLSVPVVFATYRLFNSVLKTVRDILRTTQAFHEKPVDSYLQVIQIFLLFVCFTLSFSIVTGSSPWSFLVSLGAASAILMLVFKDTILGFVASIQVSANDSVRVGDWIEMSKYGADGSVIQINLNNVKVQNFDKTIVSIPTHTLLSDSFKNYRGMQQSGGRRIKRAINIKMSSIRYMTIEEINELKKIQILAPIIKQREEEIKQYNQRTHADETMMVNGRRMTNMGLFRAYVHAYAIANEDINKDMTLMVRQLAPTEHGVPLELYMFTKGTEWTFFETVMADIFDHLFAAIKYFKLEIFELPASDDVKNLLKDLTKTQN